MSDWHRTKDELIAELKYLRIRLAKLENSSHNDKVEAASTEVAANQDLRDDTLVVDSDAFRRMFKSHGAIMYIVDLSTFSIIDANQSALNFYGYDLETMLTKRIPELNTTPEPEIRAEIQRAVAEGRSFYVFRHQLASGEVRDIEIYANPILIGGKEYSFSVVHDITERKKIEEERERLIAELQIALDEIKTLRGIIPICSYCKKVRDDQGYWQQVEVYIRDHSEAIFSHSFCPECASKYLKVKKSS